MLSQLTKTIKMALKSTEEERAVLRARSALQRFPVVEWRQRTEDFHKRSIKTSRAIAGPNAWRESDCDGSALRPVAHTGDWDPVQQAQPTQPDWDSRSMVSSYNEGQTPHTPGTPGQWGGGDPFSPSPGRAASTYTGEGDDYFASNRHRASQQTASHENGYGNFLERANKAIGKDHRNMPDPFLDGGVMPNRPFGSHSRVSSVESISSIVEEKSNSPLNKAMASFTDADGGVAADFVQKLQHLDSKNSESELSIEKFLMKQEEAFFGQVKKDKLISSAASLRSSHRDRDSVWGPPSPSLYSSPDSPNLHSAPSDYVSNDPSQDGPPMTALQIALAREVFGWPLYTIVIALGQMLSATSFQITLLSGRSWSNDAQLYIIAAVFFAASAMWYPLFRLKPSIYVLSAPWIFFGLAFFMIGLPTLHSALAPAHYALTNAATWCYAIASAAGFLFFGLNFGEEAGAATEVWTMRACLVQGSQQIWVAALWYWGYSLNGRPDGYIPPWYIVLVVWPLALMSFFFAYLMLYGLPDYYRQTPPKVPGFLKTLLRRKLVIWFLISVVLREYWLSGPYGRNWTFLWTVDIPKWQTLIFVIVFFVFVWAGMMVILTHFTKTHTWLLPIFAVGLGAPRWCQMLWGTSGLGLYVPWGGAGGPYLSISIWLWLGVLDAIQGVGLGLILLQTLSRLHVCATLAFAQMIGAICVIVARATSPNALGPGTVFPDASKWTPSEGLAGCIITYPLFWVALACQIVIVVGYFMFYRREQLSRP